MINTLYKTLYKLNSNGSTQEWSIYYNDKSYWSVSGKLNGKMIIAAPRVVLAKCNKTLNEQILSEIESIVSKKKDKKYVENIQDIYTAEDNLNGFGVMLAHEYLKQKRKVVFPCYTQPKLDGIRCPITNNGIFSRGRKEFTSCTHIKTELESFFKNDPTARLDGELYTHEFKTDFEKICKAVKKSAIKATSEDIALQNKIKYYIYDAPRINGLIESDTFLERQKIIKEMFNGYKNIVVVETIIAYNEDELITLKEKWINEGYEGIMIRNMYSPYEDKRSYNLLKWKDFIDEEFIITNIIEGNGKLLASAGSFTFKMNNGKTFNAKMIGSIERLQYYYNHPEECLGKLATVRFQNYTSYGIPRFPVCTGIRDYE